MFIVYLLTMYDMHLRRDIIAKVSKGQEGIESLKPPSKYENARDCYRKQSATPPSTLVKFILYQICLFPLNPKEVLSKTKHERI